jgi:Flp pilus assembly protein TadG
MRRNGRRGQGLVEFALVVPILLRLVLGAVELGRAWMTRNIMTGAAREAVRIYVVPDGSQATAEARAREVLASGGITMSGLDNVSFNDNGAYSTCTVTVTHEFKAIFGGFIPGLDNLALASSTSMRREY